MPDGTFHGRRPAPHFAVRWRPRRRPAPATRGRRPLYSPAMQVGFIGSGNMAAALARGWGEPVLCSDSGSGRAKALAGSSAARRSSNREVAERADS